MTEKISEPLLQLAGALVPLRYHRTSWGFRELGDRSHHTVPKRLSFAGGLAFQAKLDPLRLSVTGITPRSSLAVC